MARREPGGARRVVAVSFFITTVFPPRLRQRGSVP